MVANFVVILACELLLALPIQSASQTAFLLFHELFNMKTSLLKNQNRLGHV
jgi:hypothetical protein